MSNVGSVKSSSHIGEPRRRVHCLAISRAAPARRKKDIDIVLEAPAIEYHLCGRPGQGFLASERRYQGARDGRRLGTQAATDRANHNDARGKQRTLLYGFESAAKNEILLYALAVVPPPISLKIQATPHEVSPSSLCSAPHRHSSPLLFSLCQTQAQRTADHASLSAALKTLAPRFPGRHLSLSLRQHSDIPTF